MYQRNSFTILPGSKLADMIPANPYLMLMLEHFDVPLVVHEMTVEQVCAENSISLDLFLTFANLFNGHLPSAKTEYAFSDVKTIVDYLKKGHQYYLDEKYPQIVSYIKRMFEANDQPGVLMVQKFFDEYFNEVKEHLDYENRVVFPYVISLSEQLDHPGVFSPIGNYSAAEYKDHHNNIEEKLTDLNNLLIKYLPQKNDQQIRRKLLFSLFELEYDLNIHSMIEDNILIPLVSQMEQHLKLK